MACAHAKWTGKLGCCLATTGLAAFTCLNGLYDAKFDKAPGGRGDRHCPTTTSSIPSRSRTSISEAVFADVAAYSTRIMSAAHVDNAVSLACRIAVTQRTWRTCPFPSTCRSRASRKPSPPAQRRAPRLVAKTDGQRVRTRRASRGALEILNRGKRIAILAGQGALGARDEIIEIAELLGAPIDQGVARQGVVPDDSSHARPAASAC
jgi:thiamine pyrophosphate-dependent acetolactate synthase large subunit-like protein